MSAVKGPPEGYVPPKAIILDGNAFSIMGTVSKAMLRAGYGDLVKQYTDEATSGDYGNLLVVTGMYADISDSPMQDDDDSEYDEEYDDDEEEAR